MFDLPEADKCLLASGELDVHYFLITIKLAAFQARGVADT